MVSVLLVDDFEPFCRFADSTLPKADFQIVGRASDGLEAVQKAQELQPDLILLDIGLPKLNGIEAARQIAQLSPRSKIIFLTQESSPETVEAALRTGAFGYVCKINAPKELLPAIHAVLRAERFVSSSARNLQISIATTMKRPSRHEAVFYSDDTTFAEQFADFILGALEEGKAVVIAATKSHHDRIRERLAAKRFDINPAIRRGTYLWIDAAESLSTIVINGLPDRRRFFDEIACLITSISAAMNVQHPRIAFCGERVGLLWAEGNAEAAWLIEKFCNELVEDYGFDMLCAYPLPCWKDENAFETICAHHTSACAH